MENFLSKKTKGSRPNNQFIEVTGLEILPKAYTLKNPSFQLPCFIVSIFCVVFMLCRSVELSFGICYPGIRKFVNG